MMAKVNLSYAVGTVYNGKRYDFKPGDQEITAEQEKALIDAGILEAKKTAAKKPTTED